MTKRTAACTGVENGRRVSCDLAADGKGAITQVGGVTSLAYAPKPRAKLPEAVTVEGEAFTVVSVKELKELGVLRLVITPSSGEV